MREQYWKKMTTYKYKILYLTLYFEWFVKVKKWIRIITAVMSSAAIAAWTRWTSLAYLWGLLIVITQVVNAIFEIIPLQNRISSLSSLIAQLSILYIDVEKNWNDIIISSASERDINKKIYDFESKWETIDNKYFSDDALRQNEKFRLKAQAETDKYFRVQFGAGEVENEEKE